MYGHASDLLEQVLFDLFDNFGIPRTSLCVYTYIYLSKKREIYMSFHFIFVNERYTYLYSTVSVIPITCFINKLI